MAIYDDYKQLILPLNIVKNKITTALGGRGSTITAGPGNEGIDVAAWFQERIDDGTIIVDNSSLVILTGLPGGSTDLGTFTGSIISDNTTIVNALQELETYIESLGSGNGIYGGSDNIPNGTVATQLGTFQINTTGVSGRTLKLGGITGVPTNRYGIDIGHNYTYLGNVFGSQTQGNIVLDSSGIILYGSATNNLALNALGGGQLQISNTFAITDIGGSGGLRNAADYSAQFVDESLVTKRYVDALGSTVYVDSGLIGDGSIGNPLDWAGASVATPITGSGTSFFPLTIANNSITTSHIQTGTILFSDWNQNSATSGQVPQWNGTNWVASSITGTLPSGSLGSMLIHNGSNYISITPLTETQSGITGSSLTLASAPISYAPISLYRNGIYQVITDDFTISSTTVTFVTALVSTDKITVIYYI